MDRTYYLACLRAGPREYICGRPPTPLKVFISRKIKLSMAIINTSLLPYKGFFLRKGGNADLKWNALKPGVLSGRVQGRSGVTCTSIVL